MSYTVFALKWRPKNFDEIVGQNHIVSTLKNAITKDRLANAYLFAGSRGVGKTSTARILAKSLNCKDGPTVTPCQKCPSCIEISQGRGLDVIEIDGASNRGIEEIRVLRENVKFPPTAGKFKVYIIDEVHMLTTEAFNALLKTLEEPPNFVKFIFATTHPHKVLPTILSRCQRFDFQRIPLVETIRQLEKIAKAEAIDVDKDVLFAIAKASDGSLRDAESILDQLVSFSKDKISSDDVNAVLGIVEQDALFEVTDKIAQKDAKASLVVLDKVIDEGKDAGVFLNNLIEHFRNLMVAKVTGADSELIDLPQDICERLLNQAKSFTMEEVFTAFNILVSTQEMARRLDSLRIPLEISLVRLAYSKKGQAVQPPVPSPSISKLNVIECKDNPLPPQHTVLFSLDKIKDSWYGVIDAIGKVKMSVATYLNDGIPINIKNNIITVSFPQNCLLHKESLESKENKDIIEKAMLDMFQTNLRIDFTLSKDMPQREQSQDNPFVQSALDAFNARIIKES